MLYHCLFAVRDNPKDENGAYHAVTNTLAGPRT